MTAPLTTRLRDEAAEWDDGEVFKALLLEAAEAIELMALPIALQYARHLRESDAPDPGLNIPLARVLFERAQDGYVNPTGGKTTGRERKDS